MRTKLQYQSCLNSACLPVRGRCFLGDVQHEGAVPSSIVWLPGPSLVYLIGSVWSRKVQRCPEDLLQTYLVSFMCIEFLCLKRPFWFHELHVCFVKIHIIHTHYSHNFFLCNTYRAEILACYLVFQSHRLCRVLKSEDLTFFLGFGKVRLDVTFFNTFYYWRAFD